MKERRKQQQHRSVVTQRFWHDVCKRGAGGHMPQCALTALSAPELHQGPRTVLIWAELGRIYCTFRPQRPRCWAATGTMGKIWSFESGDLFFRDSLGRGGAWPAAGSSVERGLVLGLRASRSRVVRLFKGEQKGAEAQLPACGSYLLPNGSSESRAEPFAVLFLGLNSWLRC